MFLYVLLVNLLVEAFLQYTENGKILYVLLVNFMVEVLLQNYCLYTLQSLHVNR